VTEWLDSLLLSFLILSHIPYYEFSGFICVSYYLYLYLYDNVNVKLFADDAKIYTVINSNVSSNQLQNSLDLVAVWAENWQLSLSASKCSVMRISSSRLVSDGPAYKVGVYTLPIVSQFTDLGVSYDDHLNFLPHISKIVKKAAGRSKCILKCFASRDKLLLTRAFCTFVRPLLEFSSII